MILLTYFDDIRQNRICKHPIFFVCKVVLEISFIKFEPLSQLQLINMKMIKKLAVLVLILVAFRANSQWNYGATLNYSFPIDDLYKGANNGYCGKVHVFYTFDEYISAGITSGYMTFQNKNSDSKISPLIDGKSLNIIPVMGSFKVYLGSIDDRPGVEKKAENKLKVYLGLDVGWAYANLNLITNTKNCVIIEPALGMDYAIADHFCLRFCLTDDVIIYNRLNGGSDLLSFVGLSIGGVTKF